MTTNDELSRLRAAFAAPVSGGTGTPEPEACPPSDRIWLAVRGELPPDELREIVDHIATCPACAEDWRIAMAFEEESRGDVPVPAPAPRSFVATVRQRAWMAIAASVLVAFIGFQGFHFFQPKPEYRGGDETGIQSLVEGPSLPRDAFILRWTPVAGAEAYNLEVMTVGLDHLYSAEGLTTTTCQIPPASLARLRSGDKVHWMVTPVGRDGGLLQGLTITTTLR
jgi:hypothetical protein